MKHILKFFIRQTISFTGLASKTHRTACYVTNQANRMKEQTYLFIYTHKIKNIEMDIILIDEHSDNKWCNISKEKKNQIAQLATLLIVQNSN